MKIRIAILPVLFLINSTLISSESTSHPFYVSIIQIDENLESNSFEVTFKIFTDDLEQSIMAESGVNPRFSTESQSEKVDILISDYLRKHFKITIDEDLKTGEYLGFESEFDVIRVYMEFKNLPKVINQISISTNLLIDQIPDQSNIIHVNRKGETKSLILNSSEREGRISYLK